MKPTIGLVQGDACGIGPELMVKLLTLDEVRQRANIVIFSDRRVFQTGEQVCAHTIEYQLIERLNQAEFSAGVPNLLDLNNLDPSTITPAQVSATAGAAAIDAYAQAVAAAAEGSLIGGVCFTPFNKQALHLGGLDAEDELQWTKRFLDFSGTASEFNVADGMWNGRVTSHVPLKDVSSRLSIEGIVASIKLADETLKAAGFARPRIAVAALNPHAGDGGAIGREEIDIIRPAVERAQTLQINAEGPFPSDTLYLKIRAGDYDCAVTMYHDQGQIAIKLLGFERGVSVLGGLPVPITTPAHGTAFDIVGQNRAHVEPTRRAFMMVAEMAENRSHYQLNGGMCR